MNQRRGWLVAALGAFVFALALFLRGHPYDQDQLSLALPYGRIFRDAVSAHRFPLWTHAIWCGYPAHAEGQGGFLALPFRLVAFLPVSEVVGLELEIGLALVLAAAGGAFAARELGGSAPASAGAGLVWALGGGLLAYQENTAVLEACAFMPLALGLAARHAHTGETRAAALAGAVLGLMFLAGWPYAILLLTPVLTGVWLLAGGARGISRSLRGAGLGLALTIGMLLGGAQIFPTLDLLARSDRASGLDPAQVLGQAPFHLADLARLVSPAIPMDARTDERSVVFAYLGLPALVLAALGIRRGLREGGLARFFTVVLLGSLGLALLPALAPGLAEGLVRFPPFSLVRGPAKLLILVGLATSFLVASGIDSLPRGRWLAVLVLGLDLFQYGQRRALVVERALLETAPDVARAIPRGERAHALEARSIRFTDLPATPAERLAFWRENATLDPDTNVLHGIGIVGGYGPLPIARSRALAGGDRERPPTLRHLARASAPWLVAPRGRALPPGLSPVATFATTTLLRLEPVLPRARVASSVVVAATGKEAFLLAGSAPLDAAILEEDPPPLAAGGRGSATLAEAPGELTIEAQVERGPALVVLAESYDPGWEATRDGAPLEVVRADFAFMGVVVPEGASTIVLRYRPASFTLGLAATALALAGFAVALALGRRSHVYT